MAGFIDFGKLKHFRDGDVGRFWLSLDGRSLKEYIVPAPEGGYGLYLPVVGTFFIDPQEFDPEKIEFNRTYDLSLQEDDRSASIKRGVMFYD